MTTEEKLWHIWVNWDDHIASFQPTVGFETVTFFSRENYEANLQILLQSGFRFQ